MNFEVFHFVHESQKDNSITKRGFMIYSYQQGARINDPNQSIVFFSGENKIYHQMGNGSFEFEITLRKMVVVFMRLPLEI